ncbi:hypothetical protein [Saccharopolyspora pogona]|uniref:hypothetical protein n=1 Tax=Saccharopolyspora pogona TaxID=333966 RepID=UPI001688C887|nr:hypothetical protein [Saccharopolyspora pogona]
MLSHGCGWWQEVPGRELRLLMQAAKLHQEVARQRQDTARKERHRPGIIRARAAYDAKS